MIIGRRCMREFVERHPFLFFLIPASLTVILGWSFFDLGLSPDDCIYLDIGANLAQGKGYTTSILNWFFEPWPIVSSAWIQRQPLYPLLLAGYIYLFGLYKITLLKTLIFSIYLVNIALIYDWVRRTEGVKAAFFTALYLCTSPILLYANISASNNALFTFLVVISVYVYLLKESSNWSLLLGFFAGLAYLTRLEGTLLFLFFGGVYLLRRKWRHLLYLGLTFVITISPLLIARQVEYGDFSKSVHAINYGTLHAPADVMHYYEGRLKTFKELFGQHKTQILKQMGNNIVYYANFFLGPYVLSFFLLLMVFSRSCYFSSSRGQHLVFFFLFWLLSLILHWPQTHIYDRCRITAPLMFIIVPAYVIFMENFFSEKLGKYFSGKIKFLMPLIIIVTIFLNQLYTRPFVAAWAKNSERITVSNMELFDWINNNTVLDEAICADLYYLINYFTRRPSLKLPKDITLKNVDRFLTDYPIKLFIVSRSSDYQRRIIEIALRRNWPLKRIPKTDYFSIIPSRSSEK